MTKKITILLLGLLLLTKILLGQEQQIDQIIFNSLQEELDRNSKELILPGYDKPFFISYALSRAYSFEITCSLGALISSFETPCSSVASIRLLEGNYQFNNEYRYSGQFTDVKMPAEVNYNMIRRNLWQGTDIAYKQALQEYAGKMSYLRENPIPEGESYPDDLIKIKPTVRIPDNRPEYHFDRKQWEKNLRELSALFRQYNDFFNSSVSISGVDMDIYKKTTEGVMMKQPISYISLSAQASVRTDDGVLFGDVWSIIATHPDQLPPLEEIKKQLTKFAQNLMLLRQAPSISEYYSGPVLFEEEACSRIFTDNLLNHTALYANRQMDGRGSGKAIENRIGKKILDSKVTIKNYSTLNKYNNVPLLGAYDIDAEGVIPEKEITLIEDGILKNLLNGRYPTKRISQSTGSSRYVLSAGKISFTTAPGTLHISVKNALKAEKMKKALLKAAKEERLDYTYIVRKFAGQASLIYRVDVKDGSETMVRTGEFSPLNMAKLKNLLAVSAKENVSNHVTDQQVLSSVIYPSSILMGDVEINRLELKKGKEPVLEFPLKRTK
ncbi:MAG: metallopeptidase TldD-related protein [Odoribacter sp.]